ncbi:MAG TPA: cytochrome d ubiquinol oxidase subunit II [Methylophilaceae bacterium]
MIFDYATLKLIWWVFILVLLLGFAVTDGFDMGVAILLPFLGKTNEERRVIINTVGPVWEGNQTWFITAGGATFAAWPLVYATAFSGFYVALLLVLFSLFFRPAGFDYRSKIDHPTWRNFWDWALFVGGAIPALIFGVAVGNLLLGVPFHFEPDLRSFYTGTFWQLLNPFALLSGLLGVAMLAMHGAAYLNLRTDETVQRRARAAIKHAGSICIALFVLAGLWVAYGVDGYQVTSAIDGNAYIDPLHKIVERSTGAWLNNYRQYHWMLLAPLAALGGLLLTIYSRAQPSRAFVLSGVSVIGIIMTAACSMFPFIMPSSSQPNHSLTMWDATSSHMTLQVMFWVTVIFLPLIMLYTSWVYRVMRGTVTTQNIKDNTHTAY